MMLDRLTSALRAVSSKTGLPVSLVSAPNSTAIVPTPAVHVTEVSPRGTPWRRFTVPYGIPVGVSNAGSSLKGVKGYIHPISSR